MDDQRVRRAIGVLRAGHVAPLQAVLRVDHCVLIGSFSDGQALQADAQTCLVHHGEHGAHAFVLGAQQIAGRLVIVHHAGRVAVDAHLLLDLADRDAVARAKRAVLVHEELRHDKQRDTFDPVRTTRNFCQHQVNDVVRHVVIASRDENLLAGNLIGTVALRFGLGAHQAQIRAAMRLGQVHGAGPFAGHHLGQVFGLLRVGAMGMDRGVGAVGQALIHGEGLVRRREHLSDGRSDQIGHTLTAIFGVAIQTRPTAFFHLRKRVFEPGGCVHHAVLKAAPL